jgi:hypothetical protein
VRTGLMIPRMAKEKSKPKRSRGQIETLPSGSLRVSLYAGTDPVTKDRIYLRETVPAGPNTEAEEDPCGLHPRGLRATSSPHRRDSAPAHRAAPRRRQTRHQDPHQLPSQAEKHIIPCIGRHKVRAINADITDSFYSELRRCRDHCDGRPQVQHRTAQPHDCDGRCKPHVCKPLSESSILYIHQSSAARFDVPFA